MNSKIIKIMVITIIMFLLFPFFQYYLFEDKIEKFTNSNDFNYCRSLGFRKELCLQNLLPNQCHCFNGSIGIIGAKGKCICNNQIPNHKNVFYTSNYGHNKVKAYNY